MIKIRKVMLAAVVTLSALTCVLAIGSAPAQAAKVRSKLGSFGPDGPGKGGFAGTVQSVAVDDSTGNVYVFVGQAGENGTEGGIYKFNAKGEPEDFSGLGQNVIEGLSGYAKEGQIAIDNSTSSPDKGDIYFAGTAQGHPVVPVQIYGPSGTYLGGLSGPENEEAEGCGAAVDPSGNFYFSMYFEDEEPVGIFRYAPLHQPIKSTDLSGELKVEEQKFCDIAADSSGNIYAAGRGGQGGVTKFDALQFEKEEEPPAGTVVDSNDEAATLAVDPVNGDVYINEQSDVAVYSSGGVREEVFGSGSLSESYGVAVSEASGHEGQVYVAAGGSGGEVIIYSAPTIVTNEYSLKVQKTGSGETEARVTSLPVGIECGSTCEALFPENGVVKLTEAPGDAEFVKWTGCESEPKPNECVVTMTAAKTVEVEFVKKHLLTVEREGTGSAEGKVTSSPPGVDCGVKCTEEYKENDVVTLTEVEEGATFVGWTGCESEPKPNECVVTMTAANTVKAKFAKEYLLTLEKEGPGANEGKVTSSPSGIDCGATCNASFPEGEMITLREVEEGATFGGWSGASCVSEPTPEECVVTMTAAKTVKAKFGASTGFSLDVYITGDGEVKGAGLACTQSGGPTCSVETKGSTTLTAKEAAGYVLAGWIGCRKTSATECEIDVTAPSEVTAVFLKEGKEGPAGTKGEGVTIKSFSGDEHGCTEGGTEIKPTSGSATYICNGVKGTNGANGSNGAEGKAGREGAEGKEGKEGKAGTNGTDGEKGAQGPAGLAGVPGTVGPAGPSGKEGPAGKVDLVTCQIAKKGKKKKQSCTTKVVSGTVTFTATGMVAQATLSRHGVVYAAGTAHDSGRHMSLRLLQVRKLRRGNYTLTLISGAGRHESIHSESFTLS